MPQILTDTTMTALEKGLDGAAARQRALAANIANLETPGYQPQVVSFEDELRHALSTASQGGAGAVDEVARVSPTTTTEDASAVRLDDNSMDVEAQIATLGKNSLQQAALLKLMSMKFEMIQTVVKS